MKKIVTLPTRKRIEVIAKQTITREFPTNATAHVAVGDIITPETVIAAYQTSSGFHLLHLGKTFGSAKEMTKYLHKQQGDKVYTGEILVEKPGVFGFKKRTLKSPVDGTIESLAQNGDMTIRMQGSRVTQASLFWGTVTEIANFIEAASKQSTIGTSVEPKVQQAPSITIETQSVNLYGVVGSGRKREGRINVLCPASDFMLPSNLDESMEDCIIICGALIERGFIEKALKLSITGIMAGGIHLRDATAMGMKMPESQEPGTDIGVSILATEGFGPISLNVECAELLSRFNNRFGMLDGNAGTMTIPLRKDEVLSVSQKLVVAENSPTIPAKAGQKVRVIDGSEMGRIGQIVSIASVEEMLMSGLAVPMLAVAFDLPKPEKLYLPATSVEAVI